jgi:hypothetical protein
MNHPDSPREPLAGIAAEFGDEWEVSVRPGGLNVIAAYKQTEDGRHRRYIVARSAAELLMALREDRDASPDTTDPGQPDRQ